MTSLPPQAVKNGAKLVIINRDPAPLDRMAHLVLHEKASEVLGPLASSRAVFFVTATCWNGHDLPPT